MAGQFKPCGAPARGATEQFRAPLQNREGPVMNNIRIEQLMWGRPASLGVILAALAAVVILAVFLYRRSRGLPRRIQIGLLTARLVLLGLIVVLLFEPTAVVERCRAVKRRLPVLIDVSESMSIRDQRKRPADAVDAAVALGMLSRSQAGDVQRAAASLGAKRREAIAAASRIDLARNLVFKSARPVFEELGKDLDVDYYTFGKTVRLLGEAEAQITNALTELSPGETGTSIADSL